MRRHIRALLLGAAIVALGTPATAATAYDDPPAPMIIGGENATETYSFMASMQNSGGGHFCGGTLIRPKWVLTARHCMAGESPSGVQVRIGSTQRSSGGTVARVSRWVDHPNADTSLVELTAPVSQQPARVASSVPVGGDVRLLGWGCTTMPDCGPAPEVLQQLDTTILPDSRCGTDQYTICLLNRDGWRSACYGDSGGPAVVGSTGNWQLVGDTSGGPGVCGSDVFYYAELPTIRPWIESIAGPERPDGPVNLALNRPTRGSTPCNGDEAGDKAVNGSVSGGNSDKWCSGGGPGVKTLDVDLGGEHNLRRLVVKHAAAGGEDARYNTRDFDLAVSTDGGTWSTVAQVRGNSAGVTEHTIAARARWIRLSVIAGEQTDDDNVARIYEFEAYT